MLQTEFPEESFDGVLAFYSLIHVPKENYSKVFTEWKRLLIPKGHLAIVGHKGEFSGLRKHLDREFYFQFFDEDTIETGLKNHGFKILSKKERPPIEGKEMNTHRLYYLAQLTN